MRKFTATVLLVTILVFFAANSFTHAAGLAGNIKSVKHCQNGDCDEITISVDNYKDYNTFRLSNPDRIVIDISNTSAPERQQKINVGGILVKFVRYAQFKDNVARVVLDVDGQPRFKVDKKSGYLKVYVSRTGKFPEDSSQVVDRGDVDRKKVSVGSSFDIEYVSDGSREDIIVTVDNYEGYNVFTLLDPDRIVIDIPNASAPGKQQKIDINSEAIKGIRYAQYEDSTARIVLDMKKNYGFQVEEEKGKLVLSIDNPVYENITLNNGNVTYYNKGDRVCVTLDGVKLTEGGEKLKRLYTEKYDTKNKTYTVTFSSELGEVKSNVMKIDDSMLESIKINKNEKTGDTSIVFHAKENFTYLAFTRDRVNNTAITIMKPASKQDKLVVIDAGHGDREPGAMYGDLKEKDLNLDIALRLNKLLKEKNVKTYMIREDDSYVFWWERAYIANALNATMFLSIHNNAMTDQSYLGTETLCYSKSSGTGFNGYKFAGIVQENLISKLGTFNRGVKERPNLAVLKGTVMPAALAEIAFMTNAGDRKNLQNEAFRQKAADALSDAVVEALKQVK